MSVKANAELKMQFTFQPHSAVVTRVKIKSAVTNRGETARQIAPGRDFVLPFAGRQRSVR